MKKGIFAVINIGASALRMQISSFDNGIETILEYIVSPLRIGKDTFSKGFITLENVNKAVSVMSKFAQKLDEYDIWNSYKGICTSGVRDAENRFFFIDKVMTKTGIQLEIIDELEELYVKYVSVKNDMLKMKDFEKKGFMLMNFSSGNIGINIVKDEINLFSSTLPYGSLRIAEQFRNVPDATKYKSYELYSEKLTNEIKHTCPEVAKLKHLIGSGSSINLLVDIISPKKNFISKSSLEELFETLKGKSYTEISSELKINEYNAEVLPAITKIYISMLTLTNSKELYFSRQTFPHQLLLYYSKAVRDRKSPQKFIQNLYFFGKKYNLDEKHSQRTEAFAEKLFNTLEPIHSMGTKEKLMLESAAILHDIGYFIDIHDHHQHSYYIINSLKIPGYGRQFIEMIALISLYHRNKITAPPAHSCSANNQEKQLLLKKMVALLKIADSLDASHMQLIDDIEIDIAENEVKVTALCKRTPYTEIKTFNRKNRDFLEIYGIPIKLGVKLNYE